MQKIWGANLVKKGKQQGVQNAKSAGTIEPNDRLIERLKGKAANKKGETIKTNVAKTGRNAEKLVVKIVQLSNRNAEIIKMSDVLIVAKIVKKEEKTVKKK